MKEEAKGSKADPGATAPRKDEDPARATELMVSAVLRSGVIISAAVIVFGIVLLAIHGFKGIGGSVDAVQNYPHSLGLVVAGLARLDPLSVISFGLLLIIITPVTRVAVSIIAFAMEGDWRYVGITAIVLAVLLLSFALGKAGS